MTAIPLNRAHRDHRVGNGGQVPASLERITALAGRTTAISFEEALLRDWENSELRRIDREAPPIRYEAECSRCQRTVRTHVPKHGDGTVQLTHWHKDLREGQGKKWCRTELELEDVREVPLPPYLGNRTCRCDCAGWGHRQNTGVCQMDGDVYPVTPTEELLAWTRRDHTDGPAGGLEPYWSCPGCLLWTYLRVRSYANGCVPTPAAEKEAYGEAAASLRKILHAIAVAESSSSEDRTIPTPASGENS